MWGRFRVAGRSNPTLSVAGRCGQFLVFQGAYTNRVEPRQKITHERIIVLRPLKWILVWDTVEAVGAIETQSHCHFAPGWHVSKKSGGYRVRYAEDTVICFYPIQVASVSILESQHAPEFGKTVAIQNLTMRAAGRQHLESGYLFAIEDILDGPRIQVKRKANIIKININQTEQQVDLGVLTL